MLVLTLKIAVSKKACSANSLSVSQIASDVCCVSSREVTASLRLLVKVSLDAVEETSIVDAWHGGTGLWFS